MEDVVKRGTATDCQLDNMAVAGKTGTTNDYTNLVFAGFTPYYTAAIWTGYDIQAEMPSSNRSFHRALWQKVMERIHEGLPEKEFEMPATVREVSICSETGLLARSSCDAVTEYYAVSDIPTRRCSGHYVAPTPTPTPEATPETSETETQNPEETPADPQTPSQDPSDQNTTAPEENTADPQSEPSSDPQSGG